MKYIKIFETFDNTPQVDDYAIIDLKQPTLTDELQEFTLNTPCQIKQCSIKPQETSFHKYVYQIEYTKIPMKYAYLFQQHINDENIQYKTILIDPNKITYRRWLSEDQIVFFSNNKQDCETYIEANKYNV